jgi:2-oxoglutarate dehydrogenase complex dehydrogenase (E1) component-like enzyme
MDELSNRGFSPQNTATVNQGDINKAQSDSFKVFQLIRAYMTHGHFGADLDPLNLAEAYGNYGATEKYGI